MIIGICPSCNIYEVLQVKSLSCGSTVCLCNNCEDTLKEQKPTSEFAQELINQACNIRDTGKLCELTLLKKEAQRLFNFCFITKEELIRIQGIFITKQPI